MGPGACTVATVIREPAGTTLRFVAWYLAIGAARVVLHFDDPDDPAIPVLQKVAGVTCVPCTDAFWADLGLTRQTRFTRRQNAGITAAYKMAETPWFLAVDGDELVHLAEGSLSDLAAGIAADVPAVRFTSAEAVATEGGGLVFRIPIDKQAVRRVYSGDTAFLLIPRQGLVGHADGKSMTRTGLAVSQVRQHWAEGADGTPVRGLTLGRAEGAALLHFFDAGFESWHRKLTWRTESWGFSGRVADRLRQIATGASEAELRAIHRDLHHLDPVRQAALVAEGGCFALDVDFDAPARALFGAMVSQTGLA